MEELILVDRRMLERGVPVGLINKEARKEKLAVPPHVLLHYYFTRKPLITARLAIGGCLLRGEEGRDKQGFTQLMGLDSTLRTRAYHKIPEILKERIRKEHPRGLTLLDPFAGSGTIPLEALRLGIDVVALDYNSVAYLVMKGTLEYPLKYGGFVDANTGESKLFLDVKHHAEEILKRLRKKLVKFFPDYDGVSVRCYIHAWAIECPVCGRITPLVNNWVLDAKNEVALRPIVKGDALHFQLTKGKKPPSRNMARGKGTCAYDDCMSAIPNEHIVDDILHNEREMLLAIYGENGEFYQPREVDELAIRKARAYLKKHTSELAAFIPNEAMSAESACMKYLTYWYRLFSPRQLLVHASFAKEIRLVIDQIAEENKDYAATIGTYLSMIFSKHLMRNCRSAIWDINFLKTAHILTSRRPSMMWKHPELNPFVKTAGSILNGIQNILSGLRFLIENFTQNQLISHNKQVMPKAEIVNGSILSWEPKRKFSLIITDPPYYNDVQYPELMHFFQVWYSRIIGDLLGIPATPSTTEELSVGKYRSEEDFESRMLIAIKNIHNLLVEDGVLSIFYAHKSIEGWKYLLESLRKSGFKVTSTYTLRTESGTGTIVDGTSSVFHSLLLTARKRLDNKTINIADLEIEVRKKMDDRYDELVQIYGDDRVNLMVAASGIVIEAITSYSEITSFTKNTAEYALEIGQQYLIELFAKRALNIDYVDPKTMLYIWLRYSPMKEIPFSEFNQSLKAMGINEDEISDIIYKDKSKVRLLDFSERGALEINGAESLMTTSVIDSVQLILRSYMRGGVSESHPLLRTSPYGEETILHTIEGLARLSSQRPGYEEGEVCRKFLKDWGIISEDILTKQAKIDEYLKGDDTND
jgi:adenine-specific DNA methylase